MRKKMCSQQVGSRHLLSRSTRAGKPILGGTARTGQGVMRASPTCFVTHYTQKISKAAVVNDSKAMYVCMYVYVKIRRHQHTRVHAHTGPPRQVAAKAIDDDDD